MQIPYYSVLFTALHAISAGRERRGGRRTDARVPGRAAAAAGRARGAAAQPSPAVHASHWQIRVVQTVTQPVFESCVRGVSLTRGGGAGMCRHVLTLAPPRHQAAGGVVHGGADESGSQALRQLAIAKPRLWLRYCTRTPPRPPAHGGPQLCILTSDPRCARWLGEVPGLQPSAFVLHES